MKILHISDLHYKGSHNVLDKLSEHITEKIDLCLFTGDIVDKNSKPLSEAYSVLKKFNDQIKSKYLFITCGNHDINRQNIRDSFKTHIATLKNENDINNYVKENRANDFTDNLVHLKNYNNLLTEEYKTSTLSDLYAIHKFDYNGNQIAVVDLNFSWCAFDEKSKNIIVYPPYIIRQISDIIKEYDFKILITHYLLDFLNENCRKTISEIVHKNFDCHFVGHSHENELSHYQYSESGMLINVSSSTMDDNDCGHRGYSLLDIDLKEFKAKIYNNIWHNNNKFIQESVTELDIPTNEAKKNEIELSKRINIKLSVVTNKADQLFVPTFEKNKMTFNEMYTKLNIKTKDLNEQYSIESHNKINHTSKNVPIEDFYGDTNYLIYGREKSGKSALLYKLMIDLLEKFSQNRMIPIYIDMRDYNQNFKYDMTELIMEQYTLSKTLLNKVIASFKIKLLIDNFNYNVVNNDFFNFIKTTQNCSFIMTSTYFFKTPIFDLGDLRYDTVYIHDISRTDMRELTDKWPIEETRFSRNEIFKKIVAIFSQLNIHFNYWTVSMFLCIIEKTNDIKLHNNSELIDLYVENLLDKQRLSLKSQKTFSYDNLRMFLATLAHYLYTYKSQEGYIAGYSDIISCYEKYKENNLRVVADAKTILDYLQERGIIYNTSNDSYTFRLNGIFEYFLAYYMFKKTDFKDAIINDSKTYLRFKNELEIYSGLRKDDIDFLLQIYYNTEDALALLRKKYANDIDYEEKIKKDNEEAKELLEFAHKIRNEIEPIPLNVQDVIDDEITPISGIDSNIQIKREYNINDIDADLYAEHLIVLGRVFRNIDDIKKEDEENIKYIFRFLINQSCLAVYYCIQEYIEYLVKNNKSKGVKEFSNFIRTFSPLVAHTFLFENVSHPTLSKIIEEEINLLKEKPDENQFKLFVLYFLLIESNIEDKHQKIKEIIDISKYWNVQQSIFLKLILFIVFKCDRKPKLHELIKQYMEDIHVKIYKSNGSRGIINEIIHKIENNK